jgi:hypothetical protein
VAEGYSGLQTSLGRALGADDARFTVSLDASTRPVVATGGWPANNARLLGSREACNGWLHVIDAVLLPTQSFRWGLAGGWGRAVASGATGLGASFAAAAAAAVIPRQSLPTIIVKHP